MQEETTQKTIALAIKTSKLTASVLQKAMKMYLEHQKHKEPSGKCFHRTIPIHRKHVQCLCRIIKLMMNMQWQRSCGKDGNDYE